MIIFLYFLSLFGNDVGTTSFSLLKVSLGPRACGMGEAFVGLANDISALWWNPAGLAQLKTSTLFFSHHEWFYDINDEIVFFAYPVKNRATLAIGGVYSSTGVEAWNQENYPEPNLRFTQGYLLIGLGHNLSNKFAIGAGGKILYESTGQAKNIGLCIDGGMQEKIDQNLTIGLCVQNIGPGVYYEGSRWNIPLDLRAGILYSKIKNLNIISDLDILLDHSPNFHLGSEYNIENILKLRVGYRTGPQDINQLGLLSGLTSGIGIAKQPFTIDYAFVPYGKLGLTHRIALSINLPVVQKAELKIKVVDSETKMPLDAELYITGVKILSTNCNRLGEAIIKDLNVGWVKVESFKEKYSNRIDSIYIISPGEYLLRIEMSKFGLGIIHGLVFDAATKKTIGGTLHYQGQAIGAVKIDSLSGSYTVKNLPSGDYLVKVSGDDTMYIEQSCTLRVLSNKITEHDFYLVKRRGKIILKGINFETGKAELRPEFYSILDEAGRILLQYPDITIEIAGHTDAREIKTAEFHSNWELSLARANAVKNYLIQKFNIKKERLLTRGYADTQPIAPNTTEAGMAKNRRTEFRIIE